MSAPFKMRKPNPKGVKSPLPRVDPNTASKLKTVLDNTLKVGKVASVASAMFDPTSMGTDDEPDKFRREKQNKVDKANFKKNFKPDISKPWL